MTVYRWFVKWQDETTYWESFVPIRLPGLAEALLSDGWTEYRPRDLSSTVEPEVS